MSAVPRQQEVLEELRRRIRGIERRPARRPGLLPSGRPEVDARLPGGGFPCGALVDLAGGPASGKTLVALSTLREAQRGRGLAAFVDGRDELYPPAARALGIELPRLLIVRPGPSGGRRDEGAGGEALPGLWAAEVLLGSGAFAAVAVDVSLGGVPVARAEAMLRRLRAAAEKGGAVALWIGSPGGPGIPAALRLDLGGPGRDPAVHASRGGAREDGHAA
jgi:protein ImuA